jgi:hypothetical protein
MLLVWDGTTVALEEITPVGLLHFYIKLLRGLCDTLPGLITLLI